MGVFICEKTARNFLRAVCSKIKTHVLETFLGQKFSSILNIFCPKNELNMQFCLKNVARTCIFIFEQIIAINIAGHLFKNKTRVLATFLG